MEYTIDILKEKILNDPSLLGALGWVAVALAVVVVIAVVVMFGRNVKWKR